MLVFLECFTEKAGYQVNKIGRGRLVFFAIDGHLTSERTIYARLGGVNILRVEFFQHLLMCYTGVFVAHEAKEAQESDDEIHDEILQ